MEYDQDEPAKKQDNSTTPIGDPPVNEPSYRAFENCSYSGGFDAYCPRGGCE